MVSTMVKVKFEGDSLLLLSKVGAPKFYDFYINSLEGLYTDLLLTSMEFHDTNPLYTIYFQDK